MFHKKILTKFEVQVLDLQHDPKDWKWDMPTSTV